MQLKTRRPLATVVAVTTAASLCLVPDGAGAVGSARAARACDALVTAIDAQQRVRQLVVESAAITSDRASTPLKFKAYQQGVVAAKDTDAGGLVRSGRRLSRGPLPTSRPRTD